MLNISTKPMLDCLAMCPIFELTHTAKIDNIAKKVNCDNNGARETLYCSFDGGNDGGDNNVRFVEISEILARRVHFSLVRYHSTISTRVGNWYVSSGAESLTTF